MAHTDYVLKPQSVQMSWVPKPASVGRPHMEVDVLGTKAAHVYRQLEFVVNWSEKKKRLVRRTNIHYEETSVNIGSGYNLSYEIEGVFFLLLVTWMYCCVCQLIYK